MSEANVVRPGDPECWPECTECGASWCLRRAWSFTKGWIWVWGPDCKCGRRKKPEPAPPRLVTIDGPVPEVEATP